MSFATSTSSVCRVCVCRNESASCDGEFGGGGGGDTAVCILLWCWDCGEVGGASVVRDDGGWNWNEHENSLVTVRLCLCVCVCACLRYCHFGVCVV